MEYLKITKVPEITVYRKGYSSKATLHLTTHHLIFNTPQNKQIWIAYPLIERVDKKLGSCLLYLTDSNNSGANAATDDTTTIYNGLNTVKLTSIHYKGANLRIRCKDFTYYSIDFANTGECNDVFDSLINLIILPNINRLYCFNYLSINIEKDLQLAENGLNNGWRLYDFETEFQRQGILDNSNWRISDINENYDFCKSYPKKLIIPSSISNNVLKHASKFRSKHRIPAVTFYYSKNGKSMTRCSQPLIGLKQSRSIQDEKLINDIFLAGSNDTITGGNSNLIVDLRPITNAMAQTALGAGTENIDHYSNCSKIFLNIDNIHVMRECLMKMVELFKDSDIYNNKPIDSNSLIKTNWFKHISIILSGVDRIIKSIHLNNMNVLVHCSDGWDRTAQVCSLVQLCLDPYFRTFKGFQVLIEKDWCSFGFKFNERLDHLNENFNSSTNFFVSKINKNFKSPIFHQFLDCVYQIMKQFPLIFEFNERFLRRLLYHSYSCQYGTFIADNEIEREQLEIANKTVSVWDYFNSRGSEFVSPNYERYEEVVYPNWNKIGLWVELFGRKDDEFDIIYRGRSEPIASQEKETDKEPERVKENVDNEEVEQSSSISNVEDTKLEQLNQEIQKLSVGNHSNLESIELELNLAKDPLLNLPIKEKKLLDLNEKGV